MLQFERNERSDWHKKAEQRLVFPLIRASLCFQKPMWKAGSLDRIHQSQPSCLSKIPWRMWRDLSILLHWGPSHVGNYQLWF